MRIVADATATVGPSAEYGRVAPVVGMAPRDRVTASTI
jgi:hypothetical protein